METQRTGKATKIRQFLQELGLESYDFSPLTEEEQKQITLESLQRAANKKRAEENEKAYWEKLKKESEKEFQSYSAEKLKTQFENLDWFQLDKYNRDIVWMLCLYFSGDERFEACSDDYSLKKGLMLFGPVGCGKTVLMDFFKINPKQSFVQVSCRKVAEDFATGGYEGIFKYKTFMENRKLNAFFGQQNIGWMFDDFGTEGDSKFYGNTINIMAEIIQSRYENDSITGVMTHITTNLNTGEIEENYGSRVRSRLREMFNVIEFSTDAKDRRK